MTPRRSAQIRRYASSPYVLGGAVAGVGLLLWAASAAAKPKIPQVGDTVLVKITDESGHPALTPGLPGPVGLAEVIVTASPSKASPDRFSAILRKMSPTHNAADLSDIQDSDAIRDLGFFDPIDILYQAVVR